MRRHLWIAILSLVTPGLLPAANWPSWRGPNQDGTTSETNFPVAWSREKNVRWRAELPEAGNSSPIVWGHHVFVTQAVDDGRRRTVMAFDRDSGRPLWQQGVDYDEADPRHKTNPHCAASPVTDGERVVASFASAGVVAYDLEGRQLWRTDLGRQRHTWGQGSSPVLSGDLVIVYHGPGEFSTLWALDKRTGEKRWSVPLKEEHPPERFDGFAGQSDGMIGTFSTPLVVPAAGRQEVILPVVNRLRAFDRDTGRPLWSADGMNPLVYASPIYADGTVAILGGFFGSAIFIKPGGAGDVTDRRLHYERRLKKHCIGTPVVRDGHLYSSLTDGFGQCMELATGEVVWEERLPASGASSQTWSSPVLSGDRLYIVNQSGDTLVLRSAPKFEVISVNPVGEPSNSTLALSDGRIFLRTETALWCLAEDRAASR
ncbi:MAG: PQQ-like beta-propeller repeat protein [Verrucomicrobiae bacterium]|nr:PQQ-like beta-propeller repeat protein [Verrucomicrobiae bacterium]